MTPPRVIATGNGAASYDVSTGTIEVTKPMPLELSTWLIKEIIRWVPGAGFAVETGHQARYEPGYRYRPTLDVGRVQVEAVSQLLVGPLVKVLVWLPDGDPAGAWARLGPVLGHAVECTWSAPGAPQPIGLTRSGGGARAGVPARFGWSPRSWSAGGPATRRGWSS